MMMKYTHDGNALKMSLEMLGHDTCKDLAVDHELFATITKKLPSSHISRLLPLTFAHTA
jgi:hypothetical protein